jgi:hypothetical protein
LDALILPFVDVQLSGYGPTHLWRVASQFAKTGFIGGFNCSACSELRNCEEGCPPKRDFISQKY